MQTDSGVDDLTFDMFYPGQKLPTYTHTLTTDDIDEWCSMVGEVNPVYLNDSEARKAGFERRIAPPMMVRRLPRIRLPAIFGARR